MPTEVGAEMPTEVGVEMPTEVGAEMPTEVGVEMPTEVLTEVLTEVGTEVGTDHLLGSHPATLESVIDCLCLSLTSESMHPLAAAVPVHQRRSRL